MITSSMSMEDFFILMVLRVCAYNFIGEHGEALLKILRWTSQGSMTIRTMQ